MRKLLHPFRALRAKAEARLDRLVYDAAARALAAHDPTRALSDEVTLVLDAVLAEQFRLQAQVDALERLLRERAEAAGSAWR